MYNDFKEEDWMETGYIHTPSDKKEKRDLRLMIIIEIIAIAALSLAIYLS